MAFDTFHLFAKLPKELKDLIWDAAVRPVPGARHVHRFLITDMEEPGYPVPGDFLQFTPIEDVPVIEDDSAEEPADDVSSAEDGLSSTTPSPGDIPMEEDEVDSEEVWVDPDAPITRTHGVFHLAVPWDAPDGGPNDSVYALDSGLWMACKGSRAAMERRFPKNEWWSEMECENSPERLATWGDYYKQDDATHTVSYKDREGQVTHITINPDQDLFYLDPRYMDRLDWFHHSGQDFPACEVYWNRKTLARPSFLGRDIAMDYDPSMLDQYLRHPTHFRRPEVEWWAMTLQEMIEMLHDVMGRRLWFIDYRLRPVDPVSMDVTILESLSSRGQQERAVFHSGDSVLIEVRQEDVDNWSVDTTGYESESAKHSPFEWFTQIYEGVLGDIRVDRSKGMRVLARLAAPGKTLRPRLPDAITCEGEASCKLCGRTDDVARSWLDKSPEERAAQEEDQMSLCDIFEKH
ncbi:hypothetical protein ACHAPT_013341 [Fusarium lateritium]